MSSTVFNSGTIIASSWLNDVNDAVYNGNFPTPLAAAGIQYNEGGTGAVTTTVQAKLQQTISVMDFGAKGDGTTDDTVAIQNALSAGGQVYFPNGTYKVTTVVVQNVNDLTINAGSAIFTSVYGNVFMFQQCSKFVWTGGVINAGNGGNPAYTTGPFVVASNFTIFNANVAQISNLVCNNGSTNRYPCVTAWNMGQVQINNNQLFAGGDNTIWCFSCSHVTASNNLILNQAHGRGITFQQVSRGAMTGNVVAEGAGYGLDVHGSDNIVITGNSIFNMGADPTGIQNNAGIAVEWDENATPTQVAAAIANPQLYNNVFCRNITISGNTIAQTGTGITIGNNLGISGNNYGNNGQVVVDGNNIFSVAVGVNTGTSCQVRVSNNMISTVNQACVLLSMAADSGGYTAHDIYVHGNRFTQFNLTNTGYNAVQFQSGTPTASQNFIITDNEWDNGNYSAGFTNISNTLLSLLGRDNSYANGVAMTTTTSALNIQPQFSDQTGSSTLSSYFVNKATNEFTQSGSVVDSFVTVLSLPSNSSIMAQIQIGSGDRLVCWGVIFAQAGSSPSLTFTGTGSSYVQMSGSNLQIKGYTSGGTVPYGGYYTIKYSLINPT